MGRRKPPHGGSGWCTGIAFVLPEGKRILAIGDQRGADDPEVRRRVQRLVSVDLVVLVLVVIDMVLKPSPPPPRRHPPQCPPPQLRS